ncbi:MAG TPA: ABC transporter ATP-binding protein [Methanocella sp.]|nr:ABC transporter ATP-binding protein [Methanocella sp.]
MIEARRLSRRFGDFSAVDSIDLEVGEGEVFGLLGPNGAGKTTTVRMLACLIRPTGGAAYVCGRSVYDPAAAREIRGMVGILTETSGFYDELSVYKNLRFYADLYKMDHQKAQQNIDYYLRLFDLWDVRNSRVAGFSKGMRQKLALTRCLVHEPRVVFMDEPTSGLDPESARIVRDSIRSLKAEGRTIFLCTHNLDEAERLCDRIAILDKRILSVDTPQRIKYSAYGRKVIVRLDCISDRIASIVHGMDHVRRVESRGNDLLIDVDDPDTDNPEIISAIVGAGGRIQYVGEQRHTLEDAYIKLVGDRVEH